MGIINIVQDIKRGHLKVKILIGRISEENKAFLSKEGDNYTIILLCKDNDITERLVSFYHELLHIDEKYAKYGRISHFYGYRNKEEEKLRENIEAIIDNEAYGIVYNQERLNNYIISKYPKLLE